jgi:hypothetical protein
MTDSAGGGALRRLLFLIALLLLGVAAAAPRGVDAATASYPVGGACASVASCTEEDFAVTTDGALTADVAVSFTCLGTEVEFRVDGTSAFTSDPVPAGGSTGVVDLGPVAPGTHTLTVAAVVPLSVECDLFAWSGTLSVTVDGVLDDDVAFVAPGGVATVSTAVAGSPRPAGITATLTRSASATATARFSVATYDGLPSGIPSPPPIRAAGYLDLQLTNADALDVIAGEFYPEDPILPPNPIVPPNPIYPGEPIVPPNPIRLAWWDGDAWSPVLVPSGPPILPVYDSDANVFTFDFNALSSPSVFQLGGTVFAAITSYYFRGFGIPVDTGMLNVAKAGRAIPLKWQVFDYAVAPVPDLDPAIVKVSSVAIPCAGSGEPTDAVEEYATGGSGLKNLGDGNYQLNWATSRGYAGTCRQARLDLGERNPDGTIFYRTADFRFTR